MTAPGNYQCTLCPAGSLPCRHMVPENWREVTLYLNVYNGDRDAGEIAVAVEDAIDARTPYIAWQVEVNPC